MIVMFIFILISIFLIGIFIACRSIYLEIKAVEHNYQQLIDHKIQQVDFKTLLSFQEKYEKILANSKKSKTYLFISFMIIFLAAAFISIQLIFPSIKSFFQPVFLILIFITIVTLPSLHIILTTYLIYTLQKKIYNRIFKRHAVSPVEFFQLIEQAIQKNIDEKTLENHQIPSHQNTMSFYILIKHCYLIDGYADTTLIHHTLVQGNYQQRIDQVIPYFDQHAHTAMLELLHATDDEAPQHYYLLILVMIENKYKALLNAAHQQLFNNLSQLLAYISFIQTQNILEQKQIRTLQDQQKFCLQRIASSLHLSQISFADQLSPEQHKIIKIQNAHIISKDLRQFIQLLFSYLEKEQREQFQQMFPISLLPPLPKENIPVDQNLNVKPDLDPYSDELKKLYEPIHQELLFTAKQKIQLIMEIYHEIHQKLKSASKDESKILIQAREHSFEKLKQEISAYFLLPQDERLSFNKTLNKTPSFALSQAIQHIQEQLFNDIEMIYQKDLIALIDHQKFLEQQFKQQQNIWQLSKINENPALKQDKPKDKNQ